MFSESLERYFRYKLEIDIRKITFRAWLENIEKGPESNG